ncbi:hypothetical protein C8F01DRAFT_1253187 [Mycena amicta]|nr:hypothetical protein C8F01DRAFT_1253187 [Mycena amicta]
MSSVSSPGFDDTLGLAGATLAVSDLTSSVVRSHLQHQPHRSSWWIGEREREAESRPPPCVSELATVGTVSFGVSLPFLMRFFHIASMRPILPSFAISSNARNRQTASELPDVALSLGCVLAMSDVTTSPSSHCRKAHWSLTRTTSRIEPTMCSRPRAGDMVPRQLVIGGTRKRTEVGLRLSDGEYFGFE